MAALRRTMDRPMPQLRFPLALSAVAVTTALLAACATTKLEAQWSNPEFKGKSLRGQSVMVACQARDLTVQAVCEDQIAQQLKSRGARPLQFAVTSPGQSPTNEAIEAAARKAGAGTVFRTTLSTSVPTVSPGPTIGIGVGGGGYRGGAAGGITLPIGGATVNEAYASDSAIVDVASGKLAWSGRATSPSGGDVTAQLTDLTRVTFEALQGSGLI
jgi:hypothetical protein